MALWRITLTVFFLSSCLAEISKRGIGDEVEDWLSVKEKPLRINKAGKLSSLAGDPGSPSRTPVQYPSTDQSLVISGSLLQDPLVTDAMKIVNTVVPASLLAIPPSSFVSGSDVVYNSNAVANCYWPVNACLQRTDGIGFKKDVFTCPGTNQWGATYDDGPTSNIVNGTHVADSVAIFDELKKLNAKATFFATGSHTFQNPEILRQLDEAGHQIGIHTWSHHPLTSLTNEQVVAELKYTESIIYQTIGKIPSYMRPPYGDIDNRVRAICNALGYYVAIWDSDSGDTYDGATVATVVQTMTRLFNGNASFVVLEHDSNPTTSLMSVSVLQTLRGLRANQTGQPSRFQVLPMATCNNHPFYSYIGNITKTSVKNSPTPTVVFLDSTKKVQSNAFGLNASRSVWVYFMGIIITILT
ncbi:chitin deacetylase, partial [Nowakowskiella sp. JEL0078]